MDDPFAFSPLQTAEASDEADMVTDPSMPSREDSEEGIHASNLDGNS